MRFIILGIGAIGGTVAAALARSGQEVIGIARGSQLDAIRARGLTVRTPDETFTQGFPCVASAAEVDFRPGDMILLATKTQDSTAALDSLRDAGVTDQPIFCLQNGVENERLALRRFPNVHGVTVIMPAGYMAPGEVVVGGAPCFGIFDIGRFPAGVDEDDRALAAALTAAKVQSSALPDVMASKYGKLLMNLGNMVDAAFGGGERAARVSAALQAEGRAVYTVAGIASHEVGLSDPRRARYLQVRPVPGAERLGSSTTQSLARGAGSVETDYLNGEIALLGRLHGVPVPGNAWFAGLGARMLREGIAPGSLDIAEAEAALGL